MNLSPFLVRCAITGALSRIEQRPVYVEYDDCSSDPPARILVRVELTGEWLDGFIEVAGNKFHYKGHPPIVREAAGRYLNPVTGQTLLSADPLAP